MSSLQIASQIQVVSPQAAHTVGELNWYAVYTRPNHEKCVAHHFEYRGIESYLPLYRAAHRWNNGCRVTISLPLFPNYLFVHIDPRDRVRVVEVPSVCAIVGTRRKLLPVPRLEIETLRAGLHQCQAQPHPYLKIGIRARIRAGPLAGFEGIICRAKDSLRVVLTIESIMRSIVVEVDADDLELLPIHASRSC